VVIVIAGGSEPNHAAYRDALLAEARVDGNAERLRITGYLPDEKLEVYLAATDLAVCPFRAASASGSLSTWVSASRRILASDIPQITEYNRLEPDAIATFSPYAPAALAAAILRVLATDEETQLAALARLRDRLDISVILDAHLQVYRQVSRPGARGRR
jgi:glycosyltransferase involved in cell wall biosynthesis